MSNAISKSSLRTLRILLGNVPQDIPCFIPNSREELTQVLHQKSGAAKRRKLIWPAIHPVLARLQASGMRECKSGAIGKTDSRRKEETASH
jgi:hypothetical protein